MLERLATVTLGYSVPWPCSIVITERCVGRYNAMFRFLAQIGYTLRQLQALRFEGQWAGGVWWKRSGRWFWGLCLC